MSRSTTRRRLAAAAAAAIAAALFAGTGAAEAATRPQPVSAPGALTPLYAAAPTTTVTVVGMPGSGTESVNLTTATAKFTVTYHGFSAAAKASFQRAVNMWATQVNSPVPITIDATWRALPTGVLGSAGPGSIWRDFAGAPVKGTWYSEAAANRLAKKQLSTSPDIVANFSSSFGNWWFGTGAAPAGKYDFQTVVAHELGHGLGFLGAGRVANGLGTVRLSGYPLAYDRFTQKTNGTKLLSMADNSAALAAALKSNAIVFSSPKVNTANGGKPAKLYAPASWQQGSSYSHLDEATYKRGNKNSLMTPMLGMGETIRTPGPVAMAIFKTTGW